MDLKIFNSTDSSGRMSKESFISKNHKEEIMSEMGYYRIYNAGNKKWLYKTLKTL